ncbi:protein of unknown function [Cardinium endosymbiont cEper1 of Encarsia pergandiella]|nr:protein of unknown function [Cardinium endosymbiont cEper1 of Encarsia pergandiella]
MHLAAKKGHTSCIKILSKEGKLVDEATQSGAPPYSLQFRKV